MNITKSPSVVHKMEDGSKDFIITHNGESCSCNPKENKVWIRSKRSWIVQSVFTHFDK